MEYLDSEHFSLLNTADDTSMWTQSDIEVYTTVGVGCRNVSGFVYLLVMCACATLLDFISTF